MASAIITAAQTLRPMAPAVMRRCASRSSTGPNPRRFTHISNDPTSAGERAALLTASTTTITGILLGAILTWFCSRWFRETAIFKSAVLSAAITGNHGAPTRGEPALPVVGARGIADSDLRPSGRARFGENFFDAQSTGSYIDCGRAIEVVSRIGSTVIVEELRADRDGNT